MKDALGHGSDARGEGGRMPIEGHPYHQKSTAELSYIVKDASSAAKAMRGHDSQAEGKYLDQMNNASTVLGYRDRGGADLSRVSHQTGVDAASRGVFSAEHVGQLREQYAKLSTVDPSQPSYQKLTGTLDRMSQPQLKQLAEAGIKFVSGLARNRVRG